MKEKLCYFTPQLLLADGCLLSVWTSPGSYGRAYQITLLSDTQLWAAQQRGLIRPDVTRREIMLLRREVRPFADIEEAAPRGRLDRTALREERRCLAGRREALAVALARVEARLQQIDQLVGAIPV
jgi:hypothetical protein